MRVISVLVLFLTLLVNTNSFGQLSENLAVIDRLVDKNDNVELLVYGSGELEISIKENKTPNIEIYVDVYQTEFDSAIVNALGEENGGEIRVYGQKFHVSWQQLNSDSDKGTYHMDVTTTIRDSDNEILKRETQTLKFEIK